MVVSMANSWRFGEPLIAGQTRPCGPLQGLTLWPNGQMTGVDDALNHPLHVLPQDRAAFPDLCVARDDAILSHGVTLPCAGLREAIQQHRLKAIHGEGELRLGSLLRFELIPERAKL